MKMKVGSLLPNKADILNKYFSCHQGEKFSSEKKQNNFFAGLSTNIIGQLNDF